MSQLRDRSRRVRRLRWARAGVAAVVLAAQFVVFTQVHDPAPASAAPAVAQTYYTPFEAQEYIDVLRSIAGNAGCCDTSVDSTISITSGANANTVIYDHFEDGYEDDPLNPVQGSTVTINLDAGDVWTQTSVVPIDQPGRGAGNYFDGRDKIVSTAPIAVTQTAFGTNPGTVHAGGVQVLDVDKSGVRFDVPAGEDQNLNELFDYVGLVIIATGDDTTVDIDADASGSAETTVTLDEGETHIVDGGVNVGAFVTADKPVTTYVATGDIGATYEGRFFELYPTSIWSDQMISPVGSRSGSSQTRVFLFNPGGSAIDIDVETGGGATSTINVGAGAQGSYVMPVAEGARFESQGSEAFYAFQLITTEGSSTSSYDWGFTLIPANAATPSVIIPYGAGSQGLTNNYSPVWVTASADTTLHIDLDGDPSTGPLVDSEGDRYDFSCAVTAYASTNVYDDGTTNCYTPAQDAANGGDRDMTGSRIYTLDGSRLSAAWGQRPEYTPGSPALDMGTTILPFPLISMTKSSVFSIDVDGDGLGDIGDQLTYTITMENLGIVDVGSVLVVDETPALTTYVANSTELDAVPHADDSNPFSPNPIDVDSPAGGLAVGTVPAGTTRTIEFAVNITGPIPLGANSIDNLATMITQFGPFTSTDRKPLDVPPLQIVKTSAPASSPVGSGETISYTVRVSNNDDAPQTGVAVTDVLPAGTTYVGGSAVADVDGTPVAVSAPPNMVSGLTMNPGQILTITFDVTTDVPMTAGTTEFLNTASTSSTEYPVPVSDDAVDPADPFIDLSLVKVDDTAVALSPGDRLVYTLTIANAGPDEAAAVQVVDTLPPDVTFVPGASDPSCAEAPAGTVTCSIGDLGVTSVDIVIAVDIDLGVNDGDLYNIATVSSTTPEGNPGDETDDETTPVDVLPTIVVNKVASPTSVPEPGGTVTFSVDVDNTSTEEVTLTSLTDSDFGDLLDAGNLNVSSNTCPAQSTTIAIGATFSCSFDAAVNGSFGDLDHVDTVTATADDDEGNTATDNDSATVSFADAAPGITVVKTAVPGSVGEPGGTVTFSVDVANTSGEALTLTSLTDDVFGDLLGAGNNAVSSNTCLTEPTAIAVAGTFSCSFDASVVGDFGQADHVDTVTATADDDEGNTATDADSATVTFTDQVPTISVDKTASPSSVAEPGGTVTFSVDVANTSGEALTLTSLTDDVFGDLLDAGNNAVSSNTCLTEPTAIAVAGTFSCSFDASVVGDFGQADHVDTVTATADDDEGNTATDADSATVTFADALPTISAAKIPTPGSVGEPGGTVTFAVTVTNTSVEALTLTSLTDDVFGDLLDAWNGAVSSNTCLTEPTAIAVAGTFSCSFDAFVAGNFGDSDHVDTITAHADDDDGNTATALASATVIFGDDIPTLVVTKTATPGSVNEPGGAVTFSVDVTNTSVEALTLTSLTDDVFGDLLDAGNGAVSSNTCLTEPTAIPVAGTLSCSFNALVAGDFGDPDHLDTVTATADDDDGNTATGQDSATVTFVDVVPTLSVDKAASVGTLPEPGGTVTFTITITNSSVETLTITSLTDDVFGDLLDVGNTGVVTSNCPALAATIPAGNAVACSFDANVTGSFGDPDHVDVVTVGAEDDDGNTVSDTDSAVVSFTDVIPSVSVSKSPSVSSVAEPGDTVTFTIQITNAGTEDLTIDSLVDDEFGDLLDGSNPDISANTCDLLSTSLGSGETVICSFNADVTGRFGDPDHRNTVTLTATDDDSNTVVDTDDAIVAFTPDGSPGGISGTIWGDLDEDDLRESGEPLISGVLVELVDAGGSVVGTDMTTSTGDYSFTGVAPASYTIVVDEGTIPAGWELNFDTDGDDDGATDVTVPAGSTVEDIDFAIIGVGSIGDTVWVDSNEDAVVDEDEDRISNAEVSIVWAGLDGVPGTSDDYDFGSQDSNGDGLYEFDALPPGTYTLTVDTGSVGAGVTATTPTTFVVDLDPGGTVFTVDFGFTIEQLPVTGIDSGPLMIASALFTLLGLVTVVDGRRRERRFTIDLSRLG